MTATHSDKIIAGHQLFSDKSSLPMVFGDGYCFHHSSVFKSVRTEALNSGVKYHSAATPEAVNQLCLPLMNLTDNIFPAATIYHWANSEKIISFLNSIRGSTFGIMSLVGHIGKNPLQHESAHFLAQKNSPIDFANPENFGKTSHLINILSGEAMSCALELLTAVQLNGEIGSEMSYPNIYIGCSMRTSDILKKLQAKFGHAEVLRFAFFAYLCSNVHYNQVSPPQGLLEMLLPQNTRLSEIDRSFYSEVLKVAFKLNIDFRSGANFVYFYTVGIRDAEALLKKCRTQEDILNSEYANNQLTFFSKKIALT